MYSFSDETDYDATVKVEVLPKVLFLGGGICASDEDWSAFDDYLSSLPADEKVDRVPAAKKAILVKSRLDPELVKKHPWLLDECLRHGAKGAPLVAGEGADDCVAKHEDDRDDANSSEGRGDEDAANSDVDIAALLVELEKKRADEKPPAENADFQVKLMGGKWLAEKKCLAYDAYRATFKSAQAKTFLYRYSFGQSASFSINKFGEHLAKCCAEYWAGKMTHLLGLTKGDDKHVFTGAEVGSYLEPALFRDLYAVASPDQQTRMQELRELTPSKPR